MLAESNKRPGVEEQYQTAGNTSDLTVVAERRGAGDVLIAAGWSPATLGGALMRLHSEYTRPARGAGRTDALLLAGQLKTLPSVVAQVELRALRWGMDDARATARLVVAWWLDRTCSECQGRGQQLIPGTPVLSERPCTACRGSRESRPPQGERGHRLAAFLDACVADWHGSMRRNLAPRRRARNKVVDTPTGRVIIAAEDGTGC